MVAAKPRPTMAMRKEVFQNGHYFHVYNRGVDKRKIFMDDSDRRRFVMSLREFNDIHYTSVHTRLQRSGRGLAATTSDPFVRILCYCLMPNHFHLLLEQLVDGGITEFMHRIGSGYTTYFNLKRDRTGRLFEGTFKAVPITSDRQLEHDSRYIHLNPLDFVEPGWKDRGVTDWKKSEDFLESYPWSSCRAYLGLEEHGCTDPGILGRTLPTHQYRSFLKAWVTKEIEVFRKLGIEQDGRGLAATTGV